MRNLKNSEVKENKEIVLLLVFKRFVLIRVIFFKDSNEFELAGSLTLPLPIMKKKGINKNGK